MAKQNQSKKQRKVGRNSVYCKIYAITRRREKNKAKKLKKHLIRFPDDKVAAKAYEECRYF